MNTDRARSDRDGFLHQDPGDGFEAWWCRERAFVSPVLARVLCIYHHSHIRQPCSSNDTVDNRLA